MDLNDIHDAIKSEDLLCLAVKSDKDVKICYV